MSETGKMDNSKDLNDFERDSTKKDNQWAWDTIHGDSLDLSVIEYL